jgi:hypothetical protein
MATNLQDVIARLEAEIASAKGTGSRIGFFASLYRLVTVEIKRRIEQGSFENSATMNGFRRGLRQSIFRCTGCFSE